MQPAGHMQEKKKASRRTTLRRSPACTSFRPSEKAISNLWSIRASRSWYRDEMVGKRPTASPSRSVCVESANRRSTARNQLCTVKLLVDGSSPLCGPLEGFGVGCPGWAADRRADDSPGAFTEDWALPGNGALLLFWPSTGTKCPPIGTHGVPKGTPRGKRGDIAGYRKPTEVSAQCVQCTQTGAGASVESYD